MRKKETNHIISQNESKRKMTHQGYPMESSLDLSLRKKKKGIKWIFRKFLNILLGKYSDFLSVNNQFSIFGCHVTLESTVSWIIFKHVNHVVSRNEWILDKMSECKPNFNVTMNLPLTPTTFNPFSRAHRNTKRPIRPKPLIPILTSESEDDMFTKKSAAKLDRWWNRKKKRERNTTRTSYL